MSLKISIKEGVVYLEYTPQNGTEWLIKKIDENESHTIKNTFTVSKEDSKSDRYIDELNLTDTSFDDTKIFEIGGLDGDYHRIYKKILNTENDVLFHKSCKIKLKYFITNGDFSILLRFERLANQQIVIGGDLENSIPEQIFNVIINSVPSTTELRHYVDSRITNVLTQYLEGVKDSGRAFEEYLEKRNKIGNLNTIPSIYSYEYEKYVFMLATLKEMLANSDGYKESDWQDQILDIILILYPKYINSFKEVRINDYYTNPEKPTYRKIDIMLVDSNANIDVIEIKKPFSNCVVSKNTYRDNYTPMKELSGTIMQVEKYIFHLNKWGVNGEKMLSRKYSSYLPPHFNIRITNPKGIVILGRDNNLSDIQLFDLEIIKRKYANIIDIITYDDLIKRLENTLKYKKIANNDLQRD